MRPLAFVAMFLPVCVGLLPLLRVGAPPSVETQNAPPDTARFAGSAKCVACHQTSHDLWSTSRHGVTVRPYTSESLDTIGAARTTDVPIGPHMSARVDLLQGIATLNEGPSHASYSITHTVGGKHVLYFLTRLERGRLQTLPFGYDVQRREWFSVPESGVRSLPGIRTDEALHWNHRAYSFTASCYRCHVSQVESVYDPGEDAYSFSWKEAGISCETCHGPSGEHIRLFATKPDPGSVTDPKVVRTSRFSPSQMNSLCASCHAKGIALTQVFLPGTEFSDAFDLVLFEHPDYYPDGQDLGENYTYTSWLKSSCVRAGALDCMHCHTSSGRFRFAENPDASCVPCHADRVEDKATHSGHTDVTCVQCHMPTTSFARMTRSDHSMLPPMPAATSAFGSPNACTGCHTDRSPEWADDKLRAKGKGSYQDRRVSSGRLVEAARNGEWSGVNAMIQYVSDPRGDALTIASLLRLLKGCPDDRIIPAAIASLRDSSPFVRAAAAECLEGREGRTVKDALRAAMMDSVRVVRIRSSASYASLRGGGDTEERDESVDAAMREYVMLLRSQPDDAGSRYNLGNYYASRGEHEEAVRYYRSATRLEPGFVHAHVNMALSYQALGDTRQAEKHFREGVALDSSDAVVRLNLGLFLVRDGRVEEAVKEIESAAALDTALASAWYALAILKGESNPSEARDLHRRAVLHAPRNAKYVYDLAALAYRQGDTTEAVHLLMPLVDGEPVSFDGAALLGVILTNLGRIDDAGALYERILQSPLLPSSIRSFFQRRVRELSRHR